LIDGGKDVADRGLAGSYTAILTYEALIPGVEILPSNRTLAD